MTLLKSLFRLVLIFITTAVMAQNKEFKMPSLDDGTNIYRLSFSEDSEYPAIKTSYILGTIDMDTIRFPIKDIGFDLLAFKVMVISPDPAQDIQVILVKNHWKDIAKTGTTADGLYQNEFRTAGQFGIMLVGKKPGVPFRLAVYQGMVVKRTSPLFINVVDYKNKNTSNNASAPDENSNTSNNTTEGGIRPVLWIIALSLLAIIGLLIFMLVRKGNKNTTILLLLIGSTFILTAGASSSGRASFMEGVGNMSETLSDAFNEGGDLIDFASKVAQIARGHMDFNDLADSDRDYEPDMDPNGQPSLPSSCLSASSSSGPQSGGAGNTGISSDNNDEHYGDSDNESNNEYPDNATLSEGTGTSNPFTGSGTSGGRSLREPKYDKNGNLTDRGDYPDAPTKVSLDPETGEPVQPVLTGRNTVTQNNTREPKYDKDGHLTDPGDYPDAPTTVPLDPETGQPVPPVFSGRNTVTQNNTREPKYDKDGNLVDPGDYPDAPSHVPIDPETGEPMPPMLANSTQSGRSSADTDSRENNREATGQNSSSGRNSENENASSGGSNNAEGCRCLQKAYAELENTRYKFEKLAVILNVTSKDVTASLALGDDVSGIHAVSGMAWQNERVKIVKSYDEFQKAYDNRYTQLVEELHDDLMKIDQCEQQMGYENWYSTAGFMYYEFARARYSRNGR